MTETGQPAGAAPQAGSAAHRSAPVPLHGAAAAQPTTDSTTPSTPEAVARTDGRHAPIGALVYFSSASENTARFVASCRLDEVGVNVYRIPLKPGAAQLNVREPYVLMVPTYGGGDAKKAVPVQVKRFLNNPANRAWIRGVIASGNTNFGTAYCAAGDIIAAKCRVPYLYRFELMGTREDTRKVRDGIVRFFSERRG
ncbi:class Ib ribonucleoside-diphosphate reductase assembly flavoprotein NrdI [Bifidobacterium leontopitheci]|nr:class Ib ribonucleoside-diphosphate reductase assembly flavoprotein NrdI [Bifidobacterium leontopitheci]